MWVRHFGSIDGIAGVWVAENDGKSAWDSDRMNINEARRGNESENDSNELKIGLNPFRIRRCALFF